MVIPWDGYPLSKLLSLVEPLGKAKFVEYTTLLDPSQMPGQKRDVLQWPYVEGLRLDEAMHPLTLLTFGLYGEALPNQDGAPVRVVVPWKYGFKSVKTITKIELVDALPLTFWMRATPTECGFYANVNPDVPHQRWSQGRELRFLGQTPEPIVPTLPFNDYAEQVAALYQGMDLKVNF